MLIHLSIQGQTLKPKRYGIVVYFYIVLYKTITNLHVQSVKMNIKLKSQLMN